MKKTLLRAAALGLTLLTLAACGKVEPIEPTEEELAVVMQAAGYDICYDELRYYTCNLKDQMAGYYGTDIWASESTAAPYLEELKSGVADMGRYNAAVLSLCAEFGISIDETAIQEDVQAEVEALVEECGSMKEYQAALAEYHMTDRLFRYMTGVTLCETELYNVLLDLGLLDNSDEGAEAFFASDDFIRTLHIYIGNDAGDSVDANRAEAEAILKELDAGADFNTLIGRHSEDFYMTTTNGYYFTRGEMDVSYETAAFALAENTYSDVVATDTGFYIIQRLPKDADYINRNFEDLKHQYLSALFYNMIEARRDEITLTETAYGQSLSLWSIE
ncbi:MAG: peptidylprolyl isomerase [Clostridia bacterium]|nr:peptidylprolyl isomerase [Clostridia bacterium]